MLHTSLILVLIISFFFIVNHWSQNKGVFYLVFIILDKALTQYALLILNSNHDFTTHTIIYYLEPLIVLQGPFFFYYLKSIMKGAFVWDRNLLLFSIPVLIFLINLIPFYALPFHSKLDYFNIAHLNQHINGYLFLNVKQQYLFIAIYNTSFILYGAWFINRMKIGSGIYIKKKVNILITRIFIVTFLTVIPSIVIMFLLYLDSNQTGFINFFNPQMVNNNYLFFQSLVLPLSFFFIPNWLYNEKEPFSFLDGFSKNRKKFIDSVSKDSVDLQSAKNSDLDLILSFIETEKPYLNPRFSLHDISRSLNIPHLRVSNCFNSALKMPFPTYRNKLRIDYVTNLLQTSSHKTISIEGIAEMSGFKSKSIFYKVFKEEHGMTPIDWIKSNNL